MATTQHCLIQRSVQYNDWHALDHYRCPSLNLSVIKGSNPASRICPSLLAFMIPVNMITLLAPRLRLLDALDAASIFEVEGVF